MNREGYNEETKFFIGTEVEHSPAYGHRTLFVIGTQPYKEVLARALNNDCPHIYLGANQSFKLETENAKQEWDFMLNKLVVDTGIWVTLDFDVKYAEWVLESGMTEYDTFIPMVSVKLPFIDQFNYNTTIKLDDKDFKATNPGVWCHSLHDLRSRDSYTDFSEYVGDKVVK